MSNPGSLPDRDPEPETRLTESPPEGNPSVGSRLAWSEEADTYRPSDQGHGSATNGTTINVYGDATFNHGDGGMSAWERFPKPAPDIQGYAKRQQLFAAIIGVCLVVALILGVLIGLLLAG